LVYPKNTAIYKSSYLACRANICNLGYGNDLRFKHNGSFYGRILALWQDAKHMGTDISYSPHATLGITIQIAYSCLHLYPSFLIISPLGSIGGVIGYM